jgi:hypothetical protein
MLKTVGILILALPLVAAVRTQHVPTLVAVDGGIGVIPVSGIVSPANADGTFANVTRNIVRGVNPAGGPWRIADLTGTIDVSGRVRLRGHGLLLAGGNSVGQTAGLSVFATLICESAGPFVEHSTSAAGVPLAINGDFRLDDVMTPVPSTCGSPVLLIRASSNSSWLAAGIVKQDDVDN